MATKKFPAWSAEFTATTSPSNQHVAGLSLSTWNECFGCGITLSLCDHLKNSKVAYQNHLVNQSMAPLLWYLFSS